MIEPKKNCILILYQLNPSNTLNLLNESFKQEDNYKPVFFTRKEILKFTPLLNQLYLFLIIDSLMITFLYSEIFINCKDGEIKNPKRINPFCIYLPLIGISMQCLSQISNKT